MGRQFIRYTEVKRATEVAVRDLALSIHTNFQKSVPPDSLVAVYKVIDDL